MRRTPHLVGLALLASLSFVSSAHAKRATDSAQNGPLPREKAPQSAPAVKSTKPSVRENTDAKERTRPEKPGKQKAQGKKAETPCYAPEVRIIRKRGEEIEERKLALTFCDGTANPSAVDSLSVLARPRGVERPFLPEIKAYRRRPVDKGPAKLRRKPDYLSEHVRLVHPGLAERLQKVAQRFPGKTIEIISGHRPDARETSRHHHARALDFRVEGVSREALRDFLRTLDKTGVGYYPNGYFVHMDVRDERGYWVDRSGPGEPADYGPWPPPKKEIEQTRERMIASAVMELGALSDATLDATTRASKGVSERPDVPPVAAPPEATTRAHEDDELTQAEIERIKADALKALEAL